MVFVVGWGLIAAVAIYGLVLAYRGLDNWLDRNDAPEYEYGQLTEAELCRIDPLACREQYLDTLEERYPGSDKQCFHGDVLKRDRYGEAICVPE